jgi:hypothetical protein
MESESQTFNNPHGWNVTLHDETIRDNYTLFCQVIFDMVVELFCDTFSAVAGRGEILKLVPCGQLS